MKVTLYENRPSAGIGVVEAQKLGVVLRFCFGSRDPLQGSAWSRCKNSRFFAILFGPARPSAGKGVVKVEQLEVFCDFVWGRATLCRDRRGRGGTTRGVLRFCLGPRDPLQGSAWSRWNNSRCFAILFGPARPSLRGSAWARCKNSRCFAILFGPVAGKGVVKEEQLEVFCNFVWARATLCGDRRGRGAKTRGVLRFCLGPRDPLQGKAWSRWNNSRCFAILFGLARPSAGIGVGEVQKLEVFCDFVWARATLCRERRGQGGTTRGVLRFCLGSRDPLRGSGAKTQVFCDVCGARETLCGDRRGRGAKTQVFFRFLRCSRDPLRGSA